MIPTLAHLAVRKQAWPPVVHDASDGRIIFTGAGANQLRWACRPGWLKSGPRHKTLFAGPWLGEFGWELLNWQAFIRALRPRYKSIVVCSRPSSEALYADVADPFIPHTISARPNCHAGVQIQHAEALQEILNQVPEDADHLLPLGYIPSAEQTFIRYGDQNASSSDVLVHARYLEKSAHRNWAEEKWSDLIAQLTDEGATVGAIGLSGGSLNVSGVEDFRDRPLTETMNLLASAKVVVGPSSGPMHLASLCGTPHVVWADRRTYSMRKTSREKYEQWWNPLETPVHVIDEYDFDPPVDVVVDAVTSFLRAQTSRKV